MDKPTPGEFGLPHDYNWARHRKKVLALGNIILWVTGLLGVTATNIVAYMLAMSLGRALSLSDKVWGPFITILFILLIIPITVMISRALNFLAGQRFANAEAFGFNLDMWQFDYGEYGYGYWERRKK